MTEDLTPLGGEENMGSSSAAEHTKPDGLTAAQHSAGLAEPYRPVAIHYADQDVLEYVQRDVSTVARPVQAGIDVLVTMDTREPIGWRIYGWSRVRPAAAESFVLGEAWPDWFAVLHMHNIAVTGNIDGRHRGGPDYCEIRRPDGSKLIKKRGHTITPADFLVPLSSGEPPVSPSEASAGNPVEDEQKQSSQTLEGRDLIEPKPCPFCGSDGSLRYDGIEEAWDVCCYVCDVRHAAFTDRDDAVAAWNTRSPDPEAAERIKALEGEREQARSMLDRAALAYEFVKLVGRLQHSGDEDYAYPEDPDDEHDALDRLVADAREIMAKPIRQASEALTPTGDA